MTAYVYMLRCRDGRYYVGSTTASLERRIFEHNAGYYGGFTSTRRPVELVFYQDFATIEEAIEAERRIKGWRRAKKEALINGDYETLKVLSRRRKKSSS